MVMVGPVMMLSQQETAMTICMVGLAMMSMNMV